MFKKIFAVVLFIVLSLIIVSPVNAATQGSCSGSDTSRILLWENTISDTSDGNDNLWLCTGVADLRSISHTLPGNCHGGPTGDHTNWDDCVSSITPYVPAGLKLCVYDNYNYTTIWANQTFFPSNNGIRYNLTSLLRDAVSSLRFVDSNRGC